MQERTVIEQLWAWLFVNGRTHKKIKQGDEWVGVGLTRPQVEKSARALLDTVVAEIITAHDWDFACDVATKSSVVNQSEYTLEGNNDDCADIWIVKYGPGRGVPLEEKDVAEMDRRESESVAGASDTSGVYAYTRFGRSEDGFPNIQLFDTPTVVDTITYRYRRMGMGLADIPDRFGYVVRDFLRAEYDGNYQGVAEMRLNKMIDRYSVGGDSPKTVRMHPTIEAGNIRRSENQGGA